MSTGLVEYRNDKPKYSYVRDGVSGNLDVIGRMIDIVKDSTILDKGFEDFVKKTTAQNGFDSYSDTDKLFRFWYGFVKNPSDAFTGVDYEQDIQGRTESIKDARTTIQDAYGDCDDFAILYATILSVLGYSPCFVITKYPNEESFQHVYTVVYVDSKRYVFDGTIPDGELNSEVDNMQKKEICIYDDNEFTNSTQSVIRNIKNLVTQTKKNAREAAPQLIGLLPIGGVIEKTIARNLFSGAQEQDSFNTLASKLSGEITDTIIQLQNGTINKDAALASARQSYSQIFAVDKSTVDNSTFDSIDAKLNNKIIYIENFEPYGTALALPIASGLSSTTYLLIGVIGLGVWYFYKSNNIKF